MHTTARFENWGVLEKSSKKHRGYSMWWKCDENEIPSDLTLGLGLFLREMPDDL